VRSSAVLLYFIVTLVLMCECGPDTTGEQTSAPSNQEEAAEADRVPGINPPRVWPGWNSLAHALRKGMT
jgi:hypothetical protein